MYMGNVEKKKISGAVMQAEVQNQSYLHVPKAASSHL